MQWPSWNIPRAQSPRRPVNHHECRSRNGTPSPFQGRGIGGGFRGIFHHIRPHLPPQCLLVSLPLQRLPEISLWMPLYPRVVAGEIFYSGEDASIHVKLYATTYNLPPTTFPFALCTTFSRLFRMPTPHSSRTSMRGRWKFTMRSTIRRTSTSSMRRSMERSGKSSLKKTSFGGLQRFLRISRQQCGTTAAAMRTTVSSGLFSVRKEEESPPATSQEPSMHRSGASKISKSSSRMPLLVASVPAGHGWSLIHRSPFLAPPTKTPPSWKAQFPSLVSTSGSTPTT